MSIRVLLADDQDLVRLGMAMVLGAADDVSVVGEAAEGRTAIERAAALHPDVVVMDVRMPDIDGIEATRAIVSAVPAARVLVLTTFDLDEYAFAAFDAGASGFLLKDARPADLLAAVRSVAAGVIVVAPRVLRAVLDHARAEPCRTGSSDEVRLATLTERERQVFTAMALGRTNLEIAAELYLSESTVKTHVGRILAKLCLRDRVHAVITAYELGLV